jgi:hypothetical protein
VATRESNTSASPGNRAHDAETDTQDAGALQSEEREHGENPQSQRPEREDALLEIERQTREHRDGAEAEEKGLGDRERELVDHHGRKTVGQRYPAAKQHTFDHFSADGGGRREHVDRHAGRAREQRIEAGDRVHPPWKAPAPPLAVQ